MPRLTTDVNGKLLPEFGGDPNIPHPMGGWRHTTTKDGRLETTLAVGNYYERIKSLKEPDNIKREENQNDTI